MLCTKWIENLNAYDFSKKTKESSRETKESSQSYDSKQQGTKELTIGDLHGNALKLLQFLRFENILEMDKKNFDQFVALYNKEEELTDDDLAQFRRIVDEAKLIDSPVTIRLIGDEVADRGSNDYFTLTLIQKLSKQPNITLDILYSNHGNEFILTVLEEQKLSEGINRAQSISMYNFKKLSLNEKEKQDLLGAYASRLKLMSYTLSASEGAPMTLYSHAPLQDPVVMMNNLAAHLGVAGLPLRWFSSAPYTHAEIKTAIDRINNAFQARIEHRNLFKLFKLEVNNPLTQITWGRVNPGLDDFGFLQEDYSSEIRNLSNLNTVHGHTPVSTFKLARNFGLDDDNNLGKLKSIQREYNFDQGNLVYFESYVPVQPALKDADRPKRIGRLQSLINAWAEFSQEKKALYLIAATIIVFGLTLATGGWFASALGIGFLAYAGSALGLAGASAYAAGTGLLLACSAFAVGLMNKVASSAFSRDEGNVPLLRDDSNNAKKAQAKNNAPASPNNSQSHQESSLTTYGSLFSNSNHSDINKIEQQPQPRSTPGK